jgi:hypothetical protein
MLVNLINIINNLIKVIMLHLENKTKGETFLVPQHIGEIDFKYVSDRVKDITPFKHFGIVAIIQTAKLREIINPDLKGTGSTRFILVKTNYADDVKEEDRAMLNRFLYVAPSDVFTGIDCNPRSNELTPYNLAEFIRGDQDLNLSIARGEIFRKVGSGSVISLLGTEVNPVTTEKKGDNGKLITTIAETVVCIGYKIVRLTDIQGQNSVEGLIPSGKPQKFIVATNLLNV